MQFWGYRRANDTVGTRNYVGIISTVVCANEVAVRIAANVTGAVPFTHSQGCGLTAPDLEVVNRTLANLGQNPNLGAVLLVSLGCESTDTAKVFNLIQSSGKPVELISIQQEGGLSKTVGKGIRIARELAAQISLCKREPFGLDKLRLGIKCGGSDTTSGIIANPLIGRVADLFVREGATVVIGETPEFLGAEHVVASRIQDDCIRKAFLSAVAKMEQRILATGVDLRGSQPSRGNIAGGLTTIEEKSLGAIAKAGTSPIREVLKYGCQPSTNGLVMVDSPAREPELLTGLAAAGVQVIVFTTGRGAPQGFPFIPVLKITGNEQTCSTLAEHIDMCLGISNIKDTDKAVNEVLDLIVRTAGGQLTAAELLGYSTGEIAINGPVV